MNRLLISMFLATFSTNAFCQSAHQWTLQKCIDYAIANNISLKKKSLTMQSATEDVKQAKAELLPSLNASTTQSLSFRPWPNETTSMVSNGTVQHSVDKWSYNGTYGINANWTVWNGNKNHNTLKLNKLFCHYCKIHRGADYTALCADSIYSRGHKSKQILLRNKPCQ